MRTRGIALAAMAMLCMAGQSQAQSFNCAYAKLPSEVAICQDPGLMAMDGSMASTYFYLQNNLLPNDAAALRGDQKAWLASRNSCGYDFNCIANSYRTRGWELCRWFNYMGSAAPCVVQ